MRVPSPPEERGVSNREVEVNLNLEVKVPTAEAVDFPPGDVVHSLRELVAVGTADWQSRLKSVIAITKVFAQGSVVTMSMYVIAGTLVTSQSTTQS